MKKLLVIYIIIVGIIFISGCVGEKNIDTTASTPGQLTSKTSTDYQDEKQAEQKLLMGIEHYIDPKLKIRIDNKNIELVSYRINDTRTYEQDPNWYVELVIQNNAKTPVWVVDSVSTSSYFVLLDSGERKRYFLRGLNIDYVLAGGISINFPAYNTVKPKFSPEFKNFELMNMNYDTSIQPVDVISIKYEVNERKWKYVIVELTNPTKFEINITVDITGNFDREYMISKDNEASAYLNPGETKFLKISLKNYNHEDIDAIRVQHSYTYTSEYEKQKRAQETGYGI